MMSTTGSDWPLFTAGFWNYLREDITYGLSESTALKMDLSDVPPPTDFGIDQGWLNAITIILGQILNAYMRTTLDDTCWRRLYAMVQEWRRNLPAHCDPFSSSEARSGEAFPCIWMMQDCHGKECHNPTPCQFFVNDALSSGCPSLLSGGLVSPGRCSIKRQLAVHSGNARDRHH